MPKRFLSKREIEDFTVKGQSRRYIRNPEKRELFKDVINSNYLKRRGNESRITAFNKLWRKAQRINRLIYGVEVSIEERSKKSANLVKENIYYRSSFMDNFRYSKNTDIEKLVDSAERKTYVQRITKFVEKYGDVKIQSTYSRFQKLGIGTGLSLNEYLEMFLSGELSINDMNALIKDFKDNSLYYAKMSIGSD